MWKYGITLSCKTPGLERLPSSSAYTHFGFYFDTYAFHYRQLYINHPEPIAFMPVAVDTAGRIYDDFSRLLFLHVHREASVLANELPEESEQFRFLRAACFANIKGSVGLILAKASAIRISIPLDLSSRSFIPLPRFMRSRRVTPLLVSSLVFYPRRSA